MRASPILFMLLLLPSAANAAATVDIELSSFRFRPQTILLEHGQAYSLHLVNRSSGGHDFSAKAFFAAAAIAPEDRGKVAKGEVELGGGEEATIRLTAPAAGTYEIRCSHFLHSTLGMTGRIEVR